MKKSFEEIYEKVYNESNDNLESERKKDKKGYVISIFVGISIFILWAIIFKSVNFLLIVVPIFIGTLIVKFNSKYTLVFKNTVIRTFIKTYDENLSYMPQGKIDSYSYNNAEFERYDLYSSDDYIEGVIDNNFKVKMAEVHTQDESTDSDGHRKTTTLFHGLFADIESPKKFNDTIKLRTDAKFIGKLFNKKERLNMDSAEFEKHFDVYAKDKIVAMQIFTSDIMNLLIDFKEKYKIVFEITLKQNHIYVRFKTGQMFEPNTFKSSLDKQTLEKYYNIINFTLDFCKLLNKTVDETYI